MWNEAHKHVCSSTEKDLEGYTNILNMCYIWSVEWSIILS